MSIITEKCSSSKECEAPHVESPSFDAMEIADWDPNLSLEEVLEQEEASAGNFFPSGNARSPQPYSFVGGERTEVHRMPPASQREPQPYSYVFSQRQREPRRRPPQREFQGGFHFGAGFIPTAFDFFGNSMAAELVGNDIRNSTAAGLVGDFSAIFSGFQGAASGMNPRDYFQGNMNDLLARMQRQDESEKGKPPAKQSLIDSLPTEKLTIEGEKKLSDSCCAVCQDGYNCDEHVTTLPCGHQYHKDCVVPWLQRHRTCPVCRHELKA